MAWRPVAFSSMERTLVICKPDAVERRLVGEIISRFERKALRIAAVEVRVLDAALLAEHYEEHIEKSFYADLVAFMSRGPSIVMVVEGPEETCSIVRNLIGATNPFEAAPGTIRGDYGLAVTENLVHGSDSTQSAQREIGIFFPEP